MEGRNRSRHARGPRDRRPSRPPLPPPDYGPKHYPVPLWEREFCSYVGNISWQRFCENKRFVGPFNNLDHWDDSGAFENFENIKERFRGNYHCQPSDIPLPDPDLYIDKVDHHCKVDPELVADLEKVWLPFDSDDKSDSATEADNKSSQNQSGNLDIYLEKTAKINGWESELISRALAAWGVQAEPFVDWGNSNSGWGDAVGNSNSGWGDALNNPSSSNNYYSLNDNNDFHAGSNNRYQQDQDNVPVRNQNSWGHFQGRNSRQRNQAEGYPRSGWQDGRGRNSDWRHPVHNRGRQNGQGPDRGF